MLFLSLLSLAIWGQTEGGSESTTTTTTTKSTKVNITSGGEWYTSPWVWVVGAAAFILLLVALLSSRGRNTVHVSKTVERDRSNNG
jgi:hypothetical protein